MQTGGGAQAAARLFKRAARTGPQGVRERRAPAPVVRRLAVAAALLLRRAVHHGAPLHRRAGLGAPGWAYEFPRSSRGNSQSVLILAQSATKVRGTCLLVRLHGAGCVLRKNTRAGLAECRTTTTARAHQVTGIKVLWSKSCRCPEAHSRPCATAIRIPARGPRGLGACLNRARMPNAEPMRLRRRSACANSSEELVCSVVPVTSCTPWQALALSAKTAVFKTAVSSEYPFGCLRIATASRLAVY